MTKFGKAIFTLVLLALGVMALFNWLKQSRNTDRQEPVAQSTPASGETARAKTEDDGKPAAPAGVEFIVAPERAPDLPPPQTYKSNDGTLLIELSEYAGYAGLIVANGGLEPSENSFFFKNYGFKVRIALSEADAWDRLNRGELAATATTVDVLACYGRKLDAVVPVQLGFSRGADGLIVRKEIRKVNDLKGKVIVAAPLNETEFFIRYLAQEAQLPVQRMSDPGDAPAAEALNLLFCEDAFVAGDAFLKDLQDGGNFLAGCVTWAPKTTEIVKESNGAARQLIDNKNLLVIADILLVNKGFANENPEMVKGLVHGILDGNAKVRTAPQAHLNTITTAFRQFGWTRESTLTELGKVHLTNHPENLSFFSGAIDAAGSFESIYQSATIAYGPTIIPNPAPVERFIQTAALTALQTAGMFADQKASIEPIRTANRSPLETDPLLSRNIKFLFEPNSATLDLSQPVNDQYLAAVKKMLQVSPGSMIVLRGHVDNGQVEEFRKQGGEQLVRSMGLRAMELSKNRAEAVREALGQRQLVEPSRVEIVARGWEEPAGTDPEQNRRVEVQWFTVE